MKKIYNARNWPKTATYMFLEPGIVSYDGGKIIALLKDETIERCFRSFQGKPLILDVHVPGLTPMNIEEYAEGFGTRVLKQDGKYYVEVTAITDEAQEKMNNPEYGISCAYNVLESGAGGEWHSIPYTEEFLSFEGVHFCLVKNPRYEDARRTDMAMMVNSKDATMQANKPIEGGQGMKLFKFLFHKDKVIKDADGKEFFNANDDDLLIDGEKVTEEELIASYRMGKKMKANADDAAEKEKADKLKAKEKEEKENSASEEEKAKKEKEDKEKADKEAANAAEADEKKKKDEEEKLKIERQNAKDKEGVEFFNSLNEKREIGEEMLEKGTKLMVDTFADQVKRGKELA